MPKPRGTVKARPARPKQPAPAAATDPDDDWVDYAAAQVERVGDEVRFIDRASGRRVVAAAEFTAPAPEPNHLRVRRGQYRIEL